eukprot:scaffold870_cov393-Prasinococcus_capsulatus_cf.AAC.2
MSSTRGASFVGRWKRDLGTWEPTERRHPGALVAAQSKRAGRRSTSESNQGTEVSRPQRRPSQLAQSAACKAPARASPRRQCLRGVGQRVPLAQAGLGRAQGVQAPRCGRRRATALTCCLRARPGRLTSATPPPPDVGSRTGQQAAGAGWGGGGPRTRPPEGRSLPLPPAAPHSSDRRRVVGPCPGKGGFRPFPRGASPDGPLGPDGPEGPPRRCSRRSTGGRGCVGRPGASR